MTHEPERDAAAFLAGDLTGEAREAFSDHLLECDQCWREVGAAQRGRALVEAARTVAPAQLRDRVRALVAATSEQPDPIAGDVSPLVVSRSGSPRSPKRWGSSWQRPALVAAVVALLLAGSLSALRPVLAPRAHLHDPAALVAAVADFRAHELPGRQLPTAGAPDLSRLHLTPIGAGGGQYAGLAVDGYAYRDDVGRRLVLYLSQQPFPTAPGASRLEGPDGPWTARRGDVVILCARAPHALLVVGQDDALVRSVAGQLGVL